MIIIDLDTANRWTIRDDSGPLLTDATTERAQRFVANLMEARAIDAQTDATRAELEAVAQSYETRRWVPTSRLVR